MGITVVSFSAIICKIIVLRALQVYSVMFWLTGKNKATGGFFRWTSRRTSSRSKYNWNSPSLQLQSCKGIQRYDILLYLLWKNERKQTFATAFRQNSSYYRDLKSRLPQTAICTIWPKKFSYYLLCTVHLIWTKISISSFIFKSFDVVFICSFLI